MFRRLQARCRRQADLCCQMQTIPLCQDKLQEHYRPQRSLYKWFQLLQDIQLRLIGHQHHRLHQEYHLHQYRHYRPQILQDILRW